MNRLIFSLCLCVIFLACQGCGAQSPAGSGTAGVPRAAASVAVANTIKTEDLRGILSSQDQRSQVCTGLDDGRPGFSALAVAGMRGLQQGEKAEVVAGKWARSDAKGALASDLAEQALRVASVHAGWNALASEDQSKVVCFAALSSYDNFLADHPTRAPDEQELLGVADRVFTTLAGLAQSSTK